MRAERSSRETFERFAEGFTLEIFDTQMLQSNWQAAFPLHPKPAVASDLMCCPLLPSGTSALEERGPRYGKEVDDARAPTPPPGPVPGKINVQQV